MKTAFITGCNGFAGQWLTQLLLSEHYTVHGIDLQENCSNSAVCYTYADICDQATIEGLIASVKPDLLFNLAGVTYLPEADTSPRKAIDANIAGTMILLDAVKHSSPSTRVLLVGSSREYSKGTTGALIDETSAVHPSTFYGISKLSGELIGLQYHLQFGIDVRCTRSFNHTGPGQSPRFVCSEWARQLALISTGKANPALSVGNLTTVIDFSDVRDVVAAYFKIMTVGTPGEVYNVCSGSGYSLQWILDYLITQISTTVTYSTATSKLRSSDNELKMVGSPQKLTSHTGWQPSTSFKQTLRDLLAWWHNELSNN